MNRVVRRLGQTKYHKPGPFDRNEAALIPQAYRKFWYEWNEQPTPVHYIPRGGQYERIETFEGRKVLPVQNIPLKLSYPPEFDRCLMGGEAIVQGFRKKEQKRRFPHFWMPTLRNLAVYSEILNKHFEVIGTDRALSLIIHHQGFDQYLMQTKANELKSLLPLKMKRDMIKAIHAGCPAWKDDPEKQQEVLARYKQYADQFTPEEAEWYGYSYLEAIDIVRAEQKAKAEAAIKPFKDELRRRLIEDLKASGLEKVERVVQTDKGEYVDMPVEKKKSWVSKLNPFGKK